MEKYGKSCSSQGLLLRLVDGELDSSSLLTTVVYMVVLTYIYGCCWHAFALGSAFSVHHPKCWGGIQSLRFLEGGWAGRTGMVFVEDEKKEGRQGTSVGVDVGWWS
jgi:hypothetical protein